MIVCTADTKTFLPKSRLSLVRAFPCARMTSPYLRPLGILIQRYFHAIISPNVTMIGIDKTVCKIYMQQNGFYRDK